MKIKIRIADWSIYPGGRNRQDGVFSGEVFRDDILAPALRTAQYVCVDMDGTRGYGSSFLEEAFGGLLRIGFSRKEILEKIEIRSTESSLADEIFHYIRKSA